MRLSILAGFLNSSIGIGVWHLSEIPARPYLLEGVETPLLALLNGDINRLGDVIVIPKTVVICKKVL